LEKNDTWNLYENSDNVADVYDRQLQVTEEYISAIRGGKEETFFEKRNKLRKQYLKRIGEPSEGNEGEEGDGKNGELLGVEEKPSKRLSDRFREKSKSDLSSNEQPISNETETDK